jgi:hypothetical protein
MVLLNTPALLSSYAYEGTADRHASLTLAWTGTDGRLNIALINFDHLDVKSGTKDTYDQFSDSSPSLAYWGGQYIAWTGTFGPPFINIAAISKYNAELSPPLPAAFAGDLCRTSLGRSQPRSALSSLDGWNSGCFE